MKKYRLLKTMVLAIGLVFAAQFASAQSAAQLLQKQQHEQQMSNQQNAMLTYDAQKESRTMSTIEVTGNSLVSSTTTNGITTNVIQMATPITDQAMATALENKYSSAPGVMSVSADHGTNQVTYTVKEEDEHNSLESYFDIQ